MLLDQYWYREGMIRQHNKQLALRKVSTVTVYLTQLAKQQLESLIKRFASFSFRPRGVISRWFGVV